MKPLRLGAFALGLFSVYCTPSLAADRFAIELATPPVWFFNQFFVPVGGKATCTAVNLHNKPVTLTTQLVLHDDDALPHPILNTPDGTVTQVIGPGEATTLTLELGAQSSDVFLARCVFKYKGSPRHVKAAVVLDDPSANRSLTAPAELTRKVRLATSDSGEG